ncbi:MAG: hypothetical protein ACRDRN_16120 [Sciscionella sp.]
MAAELGVSRPTVGKLGSRFVERRLDGLVDEPQPGAPRTITDEPVEPRPLPGTRAVGASSATLPTVHHVRLWSPPGWIAGCGRSG